MCSEVTVKVQGIMYTVLKKKKERLQWEGFAEKESFKTGILSPMCIFFSKIMFA